MRRTWNWIFEEATVLLRAGLLLGLGVTGLGFISACAGSTAYAQYAPALAAEVTSEKPSLPPLRLDMQWNDVSSHITYTGIMGWEPMAFGPKALKVTTEVCQANGPGWWLLGPFANPEKRAIQIFCLSPKLQEGRPELMCKGISKVFGKQYHVEDLDMKAGTFACTIESPKQSA